MSKDKMKNELLLRLNVNPINVKDDNIDFELSAGDIIAVTRAGGWYQHFGVYIGGGSVIHYSFSDNVLKGIDICESSIEDFRDGGLEVYRLQFSNERTLPKQISLNRFFKKKNEFSSLWIRPNKKKDLLYHLYSPEETVNRAKRMLNKNKKREYNLFSNNCEHFAIWCKTGVEESHQVNHVMNLLSVAFLRTSFAIIEDIERVNYRGVDGFLVWDYFFWNEVSFVDVETGKIQSLLKLKNDDETRKFFSKIIENDAQY